MDRWTGGQQRQLDEKFDLHNHVVLDRLLNRHLNSI
jgi:hypothetical protein